MNKIFIAMLLILSELLCSQNIIILYDFGTDEVKFPGETWHISQAGMYNCHGFFKDNTVSHIYIAQGYMAILFDGDHYNGHTLVFGPGNYDLKQFNFNDKLSSIKILKDQEENHYITRGIMAYNTLKLTNSIQENVRKQEFLKKQDNKTENAKENDDTISYHIEQRQIPRELENKKIHKESNAMTSPYLVEIECDKNSRKKIHFYETGRYSSNKQKPTYFMRIIPGYKVKLFEEPDYKGRFVILNQGLHDLRYYKFHNCLRSFIIEKEKKNFSPKKIALPKKRIFKRSSTVFRSYQRLPGDLKK